jgi:uncharacterized protein (DUF302 family)
MQVLKLSATMEDVVTALKGAIETQKLRLVSHIDGQANAARIGREVPGDQILEVLRPDFAVRVWEACKPAGIEIPIRIHVYEDGENVCVAYRTPQELFEPYGSAPLTAVGAELDRLFAAIVEDAQTAVEATA